MTLKLFAPFLPYVTDEIYRHLLASEAEPSIHRSSWPVVEHELEDDTFESFGEIIIQIATAVRRYKSERQISVGTELAALRLSPHDHAVAELLRTAVVDLGSVTRARKITIGDDVSSGHELLMTDAPIKIGLAR